MKTRTHKLLSEMQTIFGGSFGGSEILTENLTEADLEERRKGQMLGRQSPGGGRVGSKKGGRPERGPAGGRPRRDRDVRSAKKIEKAAAKMARANPKNPENQKVDKKNFDDVMKDVYKDVEKQGSKTRAEKYRKAANKGSESAGGSGGSGGGAGAGREGSKQRKGQKPSTGGKSQHYPFKRSSNLGLGPGTPPGGGKGGKGVGVQNKGARHHDETKCWKCSSGSGGTYSEKGVKCVASGSGKNCPKAGTVKYIKIDKQYHQNYNDHYHAWRAKQGGRVTARLGGTKPN